MFSRVRRSLSFATLALGITLSGTLASFLNTPAAHASTSAVLYIDSIYCVDAQEGLGFAADEVYLRRNGLNLNRSVSIGNGGSVWLGIGPLSFTDFTTVEVWEDDGNRWIDRNDFIGSFTVGAWQKWAGTQKVTVSGDGATYDIFYRVQ
jgi:hypothetical protein